MADIYRILSHKTVLKFSKGRQVGIIFLKMVVTLKKGLHFLAGLSDVGSPSSGTLVMLTLRPGKEAAFNPL